MDPILWTSGRIGVMTVECVASASGLVVDAQETARALCVALIREAFARGTWTNNRTQHLGVTPTSSW